MSNGILRDSLRVFITFKKPTPNWITAHYFVDEVDEIMRSGMQLLLLQSHSITHISKGQCPYHPNDGGAMV